MNGSTKVYQGKLRLHNLHILNPTPLFLHSGPVKVTEPSSSNTVVKLNVGGRIYTTLFETLISIPGSRISDWIRAKSKLPKDENGVQFLDRDPDMFGVVLDYLRSKELPDSMSDRLKKEFIYYGLNPEKPWLIDGDENSLHAHLRLQNSS